MRTFLFVRTEQSSSVEKTHHAPQHLHAARACSPQPRAPWGCAGVSLDPPPLIVLLSCPSVSLSFCVLGGVAIEHE